jgi:hypothetical protein
MAGSRKLISAIGAINTTEIRLPFVRSRISITTTRSVEEDTTRGIALTTRMALRITSPRSIYGRNIQREWAVSRRSNQIIQKNRYIA